MMKKLFIAVILSFSLLLVGCADLLGVIAPSDDDNVGGVTVDEGTYYEEYACSEGSDGTFFSGDQTPTITMFDNRFEMRIVADETQYVYGDYEFNEVAGDTYLILFVTQSEYPITETEFVFLFNSDDNYLTTITDIGRVTAESIYDFHSSGYLEAVGSTGSNESDDDENLNGEQPSGNAPTDEQGVLTEEEATAPPSEPLRPTDGTISPLPNDTAPVLEHLYSYAEYPRDIIDIFCPPQSDDNQDITAMIMQDWVDGILMDEGMFDSSYNGTYTVTGYFWNDITQVVAHVDRVYGNVSDEIHNAAIDFFSTNQVAGFSVGAQVTFGWDMLMSSGGRTEHYFYNDGTSEAGVAMTYIGGAHDIISIEDARANSPDGTGSGYIAQSGGNVALVDIDKKVVSAYGSFTDEAGVHDFLTLLSLSTDAAQYSSGQTEPVSLNYIGVSIITDETGIRVIGTLEGESSFIPSVF